MLLFFIYVTHDDTVTQMATVIHQALSEIYCFLIPKDSSNGQIIVFVILRTKRESIFNYSRLSRR